MKQQKQLRIIVYPADVALITGKSDRSSRRLLAEIRKAHNKQDHQLVTYYELADRLGMQKDMVLRYINNQLVVQEEE